MASLDELEQPSPIKELMDTVAQTVMPVKEEFNINEILDVIQPHIEYKGSRSRRARSSKKASAKKGKKTDAKPPKRPPRDPKTKNDKSPTGKKNRKDEAENDKKSYLEKISKFSYNEYYYTFSCFYLPENFDYASDIFKNGIHYEQNYVGLCSLRKSSFTDIGGFDEYYMVWGVEDDDLYMRMKTAGIKRNQMNAIEYQIFHQWHIKESPQYPSSWYLEMVQYLSNKKFNVVANVSKLPVTDTLSDRLLLKDRHSLRYDLTVGINNYSGFLLYNDLIYNLWEFKIYLQYLISMDGKDF
jgi:hypothetical protein